MLVAFDPGWGAPAGSAPAAVPRRPGGDPGPNSVATGVDIRAGAAVETAAAATGGVGGSGGGGGGTYAGKSSPWLM